MRVVYVSYLESRTVARQTAGAEGRQTAFVRDFGQRVDLVHELRELRGSEERIDDRRQRLGVDKVHRREHFVVAHVHAFANGTRHTYEAHRELVRQLFAHRADTTVRQVVDVVHVRFRVDQLNQILDDGYDVFARQRPHGRVDVQIQLLVDAVAAYVAQVVAFVREEKFLDYVACRRLIGRFRSAQLPVDVHDSFLFGVAGVFLQRIVNNREVDARLILLVQQNRLGSALDDLVDMFFFEYRLAVHDHVVSFNRHHFARIFVHEVLDPRREYTGGQFASYGFLQIGFRHLHFVGQVEDFQNLLVRFIADGAQQRRYGQLLLAVDVGVHHVVDVRGEFDPRAFERNDTRRIEFGAVRVHALAEEHARRAVQLRYDDTLRSVDDERSAFGHIRNRPEVHVLHHDAEIFVFVVRAIELQLGFQRDTVRKAAFQALFDRVARRVDIVVYELQYEVVPGVRDGEVFLKHLVEAFVLAIFGRGVHLEKVPE